MSGTRDRLFTEAARDGNFPVALDIEPKSELNQKSSIQVGPTSGGSLQVVDMSTSKGYYKWLTSGEVG